MRPLNTRERRIQFFRFLALFLLAVLPIVLLVWLNGRVDHVENGFLRKEYGQKLIETQDREKFEKVLGNVVERAKSLDAAIVNNEGDLQAMEGKRQDGEIRTKSKELKEAIDAFQEYAKGQGANKAVIDVGGVLLQSATSLVDIYKAGFELHAKTTEDLKRANEEKKELEDDLKECKEDNRLKGI